MRHPLYLVACCLPMLLTLQAARSEDVSALFDLPEGYELRVWASTPQLFNPTNIDIDSRGRVWVAEAVNYRETVKAQNALQHPAGDRIVILEDTNGDGVCDTSKVFVQDSDLVAPMGVAVLGDRVVVSCSPHLIVYRDTDGDDVADEKQILLTGFGGFDHDHGLHSAIGHLDGRWYFNVGNMGAHDVTDASGWRLHSGSCYVYGGHENSGNRRSDDGRIWTGGIALRVDLDGRNLTPLGHNFRNSYEVAIDSFGDMWQNDNDDEVQSCRTSWVMEGSNFGFFSTDGTRTWKADQRPGQSVPTAHWRQEDPGVIPAGDITGAGGPTGVVVYEGGLLPERFIGSVLNADAGRNVIYAHRALRDGAGFRLERDILVKTKAAPEHYVWKDIPQDSSNWFRPSDVAVGIDGAIYIADWYDATVGGHDMPEKQGQGRILRLAPRGDQRGNEGVDLASVSGQLVALNNPAINVRYAAAMRLRDTGEALVPLLRRLADASDDAIASSRILWVLVQMGDAGVAQVEKALIDPDDRLRITALRALRGVQHDVLRHAALLARDPSPAVRRELAVALRDVPLEQSRELLVELARGFDGRDRFYLEAFGIACDGKESAMYPLILEELGDRDPLKWSDAMALIAWRLHPLESLDALVTRASSPSLSPEARKQATNAIAFINDRRAALAMLALTSSGPMDVRELAGWWVNNRAGNDWSQFIAAEEPSLQDQEAIARRAADREILLDSDASREQREQAAMRLAAEREGAMMLIALDDDQGIPADLVDAVTESIHRNTDFGVRALAGRHFPRKALGGEPLPPIDQLAAMTGDAQRGKQVFSSAHAGCIQCHTFDGQGRDVGPDLTAIRTKFARRELLDAILNPSAAIAFGYEPWLIRTSDGQIYSGFILADGESVILKETSGEQRTIPAAEVVMRKKQEMSVMPDNVALGLSAQELTDLAEFLLTFDHSGAKK
jgi:putative membrane-bound dehydrogenase-like protein